MKTSPHIALALAAGILTTPAFAAVNVNYVTIGDAGNANDVATGYGGVAYDYQIAKNETTISDYAQFLNAKAQSDPYGLYNDNMASDVRVAGINRSGTDGSYTYSVLTGAGNRPIAFVSWFDAARYANWLNNGQGSGDTETGAYTLNGAMTGFFSKNSEASTSLPSENEWYKAAYYDPTRGGTGGYWLYPNQSDSMMGNTLGVPGAANYFDGGYAFEANSLPSYLTDVGAYGLNSESHYGTNDQAGNVWEWNDAAPSETDRGLRGGSWGSIDPNLVSSGGWQINAESEDASIGFRVVSVVPEPTSLVLTVLAGCVMMLRRRR